MQNITHRSKDFGCIIKKNVRRKKIDYVTDMDFNKPYQEYYNDETYKILENLSINEIERFNYKF